VTLETPTPGGHLKLVFVSSPPTYISPIFYPA
jgi:hypothetical protein